MKARKDMLLRKVAGETILIPTGEAALKIHGMISLTESGELLWSLLEEEKTRQDLIDAILQEYDIDAETAAQDVQEFIDKMSEIGILE